MQALPSEMCSCREGRQAAGIPSLTGKQGSTTRQSHCPVSGVDTKKLLFLFMVFFSFFLFSPHTAHFKEHGSALLPHCSAQTRICLPPPQGSHLGQGLSLLHASALTGNFLMSLRAPFKCSSGWQASPAQRRGPDPVTP